MLFRGLSGKGLAQPRTVLFLGEGVNPSVDGGEIVVTLQAGVERVSPVCLQGPAPAPKRTPALIGEPLARVSVART